MDGNIIYEIAVWLVPLVIAIVFHEVAHGLVARKLGDATAFRKGRLTLNPIKHVDPFGTVILPMLLAISHAPVFGWAKPVPVNFANLRNPRRDMLWVAAAGPGANLVMAVAWALVLKALPEGTADAATSMAIVGISVNLVLMALNLLPVPPLDGGRIAMSLLPLPAARAYARIEPYGLFVIVALLAFGVLDNVMRPVLRAGEWLLRALLGQ
jgi:Zn-dependent protease